MDPTANPYDPYDYSTDFRERIVERAVFSSDDFAAMQGATHGDFTHGLIHPEQMPAARALLGSHITRGRSLAAIRWAAASMTLLALAASACIGGGLASRYPPGAPPPAQTASATISRSGAIAELPPDLESSARETSVPDGERRQAASYTAYSVTVTVGGGYGKSVRSYCDYVLLDSNGLVLGAYRMRGSC